jgi:hypothetical protein
LGIDIDCDCVQTVTGTGTVSHGENTTSLGQVFVSVNENHSLVSGTAVRSDGINYTVLKTYEGTNQLLIAGNPIVDEDHTVEVDYIFTEDYSEFLNRLLAAITSH